jgi:succinylarginine dihydrolase
MKKNDGKTAFEVNFDGLVGNTHFYGGLSYGNVASMKYKSQVSNPQDAALQGLKKMKFLSDLGLKQAVLPPQERPDFSELRRLGFSGSEDQILVKAQKQAPELLASCYSASSMWTANAATVSPSADTRDGKVHFTPANLNNKLHRSIEHSQTARTLKAIFSDREYFSHHLPLPSTPSMGDEGAANHTRLCSNYASTGLEVFTFGKYGFRGEQSEPKVFPARQTFEASQAVARKHRLGENVFFIQQDSAAIDAGAFHNDVVSVGNRNFFFCHEKAFLNQNKTLIQLKHAYKKACSTALQILEVSEKDVSLGDAIRSYLFNSQLVSLDNSSTSSMALIAPVECQENAKVAAFLTRVIEKGNTPLKKVHFFDLKQSMRNGGGPACLRLRVVLSAQELAASNRGVFLDATLYNKLVVWVKKYYRDRLSPKDLVDPELVLESRFALDELSSILKLGSIYPFQRSRN